MAGPDLLERIDQVLRDLLELRAELAASLPVPAPEGNGLDEDDLADGNLLDTHAAQKRFGYPQDTIRKWCRTEDFGAMRGGRWLVSVPRLQRRLNGK